MAKEEKAQVKVILQPLNIQTLQIKIKGVTPLLMDKMPDTVKQAILEKQAGVSKGNKKMVRDVKKETQDAVHATSTNQIGFPSYGFKKALMECTSYVGDKMFSKKMVAGAVQIVDTQDGLVPITYGKMDVLEHSINGQTKFSPQFHDWSCVLKLKYEANTITPTDIVNLVNYAGFYIGLGAWRPKCRDGGSGEYGMYQVVVK